MIIDRTFFGIGISYRKADMAVRGDYSLSQAQQSQLLSRAAGLGLDNVLLLVTCNRTELYAHADHPFELAQLLCAFTKGTLEEFQSHAYFLKNREAVDHLFRVGTGLDSQILGDFEIISQLKQGFRQSKQNGLVNPLMERLCNSVIQASKRIKNETGLSSGAASVSFAAVKYILDATHNKSPLKIVLFGTGKIGKNTCENLVKQSPGSEITLINRTRERAEKLGMRFNVQVEDYGNLPSAIREADVLVVATGAQNHTVGPGLMHIKKPLLVLDLSVPNNVDERIRENPHVSLVQLDQLARSTDDTLQERQQFIPKAEAIIDEISSDFLKWVENRKYAPLISALKNRLNELREEEIDFQARKTDGFNRQQAEVLSERLVQKITKQFVNHLKSEDINSEESALWIQRIFQIQLD